MTQNENYRNVAISISTNGNNTIIAAPATTGNYLAIDFIALIPTTAVGVTFKSGSTALSGAFPLDAKQSIVFDNANEMTQGTITCAPNEDFVISLDSGVQVGGFARYREVGN